MGFSLSWIAVKNRSLDQLIDILDLSKTGEVEDFPESKISGADLPNNWSHIQFDYVANPLLISEFLEKLSQNTTMLFCQVEEHVMYSKACCWENGSFRWAIEHDSEQGLRHLSEHGDVPSDFEAIKKEYFKEQDQCDEGVDYIFDAPLALTELVSSIRHDIDPEDGTEYQVLKTNKIKPLKKPWWKIW